ncbi:hypothetical protein KJ359_007265 [Pestalotiopsis sp. 9143b]|nr:hypothetical protein KJ359_007265 [Pestalotiopsis sp. 9143b]
MGGTVEIRGCLGREFIHWSVFYAGLMMMAIFWVLTPLQSAIFGTGSAQLTQPAVLTSSGGLIPVMEQASLLDASVLNGAFATVWLNQTYPKSLTADSATLPIQAIQIPESASNTIWTGWTWQLTTELTCWPAIQRNGTIYEGLDGPILDNGQGCTAPRYDAANMDGSVPYVIRYIGWYENARLDFWLSSKYCDERFKHQFLAITSNDSDYSANTKVTAQFCEPFYYKQNITVPISSMTLKPDFSAITEAGPKMELTDAEFNRTSFEYLLGTGVPSFDRLRDYPDEELLEGYYQVKARSEDIPWPIENMPTFAIGSGNWTGVDLMDPSNQSTAYTKAHKAAFSIAISNLLAESSETQDGSITFQVSGIVVSRTISAVVEGLLVFSALLAGLILLHSWRMQTNLSRDSSSIAGIMKLTQQDGSILRHFSPLDQSSEEELQSATEQARFQTLRVGSETRLLCVAQLYVNLRNENSSSTQCYVSAGTFEQWETSAANITKDRGDLPRGRASNEIYNVLQDFTPGDTFCSKRVLLGWMRVNASAEGVQHDDKGPIANFAVCAPTLVTAPYQVTVDSQGNVVDTQRMGNLTDATPILGNRTESALADILANTISGDNSWHNITVARDWMNAFLKLQLNTTAHIDPDQPLMDLDVMIPGVEAVLKKCIAVLFGLNPSFWAAAGDDVQPIDGVAIRSETRIFMSTAAVIVSLAILVLYIIIAVLVYCRGLGVAIPRLPSTMGSVLAYVASSRALRQYPGPRADGSEKAQKDTGYSYGAYHVS